MERSARLLQRWRGKLVAGDELSDPRGELGSSDPVERYLTGAFALWRGNGDSSGASLELLHRGLMRQNLSLRQRITPLVVLGLLGTLAGVFVGFLLTFGAGDQLRLNDALRQAVVVVATACLSSVWGVGLGQLMIQPLADNIDRRTNTLFDEAIALDRLLSESRS